MNGIRNREKVRKARDFYENGKGLATVLDIIEYIKVESGCLTD